MKTSILVQGLTQTTLEGFAQYVADEQGCGWLVKPATYGAGKTGYFQLGFADELCFRQVAAVQRGLKAMGANVALSLTYWE